MAVSVEVGGAGTGIGTGDGGFSGAEESDTKSGMAMILLNAACGRIQFITFGSSSYIIGRPMTTTRTLAGLEAHHRAAPVTVVRSVRALTCALKPSFDEHEPIAETPSGSLRRGT